MGGVEDEGAKYTAGGERMRESAEEARVDFAFHCGKFVIAKTDRERGKESRRGAVERVREKDLCKEREYAKEPSKGDCCFKE